MPVTDGNRVVAEVLATTVERMATADMSWCPAATGEKLVELIARRDLDLSQALQRMVRFVRLLHFVGGRGHRTPLYVNQLTGSGCPQLSTRYFAGVIEKAGAAGCLPPDAVRYDANGVTLLEPAMASLLRRELVPFSIGVQWHAVARGLV